MLFHCSEFAVNNTGQFIIQSLFSLDTLEPVKQTPSWLRSLAHHLNPQFCMLSRVGLSGSAHNLLLLVDVLFKITLQSLKIGYLKEETINLKASNNIPTVCLFFYIFFCCCTMFLYNIKNLSMCKHLATHQCYCKYYRCVNSNRHL